MISKADMEFIQRIDQEMARCGSLRKAVAAMGENYDTTYSRIQRLGYRVAGRLMPISAPAIDSRIHDSQPA